MVRKSLSASDEHQETAESCRGWKRVHGVRPSIESVSVDRPVAVDTIDHMRRHDITCGSCIAASVVAPGRQLASNAPRSDALINRAWGVEVL
jgi:hypothetical protein